MKKILFAVTLLALCSSRSISSDVKHTIWRPHPDILQEHKKRIKKIKDDYRNNPEIQKELITSCNSDFRECMEAIKKQAAIKNEAENKKILDDVIIKKEKNYL